MDVGSLVTRLMMDAYQFDSTINKSQKEIAAFKVKAENVGNGVNKVFNGVAGTALKLVPAIAAGTTALGAFNKILKTSGSLADSFDKITLQVGSAIDYMASRAAELNFDNAISGLKESLRIAGQLAETLDSIGTLNTFKNLDVATLRRLEAEQDRARINYELNPNKETKAALDASIATLKRQQAKVSNSYDSIIKEEKNRTEELKAAVANNAGFKKDSLANRIVENLARNPQNLARSQERYKAFSARDISYFKDGRIINDRRFKANTGKRGNSANANTTAVSGLDILRHYDWNRIAKSALRSEFEKFFEKTTGYRFTKENYEKQRRFILISNKEGLGEGETDITAVQNQIANVENLEADKISSEYQSLRDEKKARDKIDRNNNKVNTKLTNTNETLEEINKKFEDAKALLSLQNKEGYLDKESYLKELLRTTDSYIAKLYDPLYANVEGIKDLRSAAISTREGILKQLKDLNKVRKETKFGNIDFNLINSNLYRQLERLIISQLGSYFNGREEEALISDSKRNSIGYDIIKAKEGDDVSKLIKDIVDLNKSETLNYGNVLATILENDELISGKKTSYLFQEAFGGQQEILSSQVYDFLNAVRIMSSLPEEMAEEFRKLWTDLSKHPEKVMGLPTSEDPSIVNTPSTIALESIPGALKFANDSRPISKVQGDRLNAILNLNVSLDDLNSFYKQNSPIQNVDDFKDVIAAFKDFNKLNDLDFFNNLGSKLVEIDKSLQNRIKKLRHTLLQLIDEKNFFEKQLNAGKLTTIDENGKEAFGRDLTDEEKNKLQNDVKSIDKEVPYLKKYINELENARLAEQGLVQVSQVFSIKQKEIKEKFDDFRTVTNSIGEVTNAFSVMDNRVGDFAKTLSAFANFADTIANLVEKFKSLNEAKKAYDAAAAANIASTSAETAATSAKTAADVGETAAEGSKQASKLPFPANVAAIAAVLAAVGGAAATISSLSRKKYATGGIVTGPGSSFSDSIPISVSNGEMILNKSQQRNLFDLLNYGGGSSRSGGTNEVNFKILGENLVGTINNRNKGRNKIL